MYTTAKLVFVVTWKLDSTGVFVVGFEDPVKTDTLCVFRKYHKVTPLIMNPERDMLLHFWPQDCCFPQTTCSLSAYLKLCEFYV